MRLQNFENRFNVNILGAMTVNPDVMPGAEQIHEIHEVIEHDNVCLLYTSPSPRDLSTSRMPSSA